MTKKQQGCRRARYCHIICRQQKTIFPSGKCGRGKWKRKQKKKWKQKQKKKWNPIDIRDLKQLVKKGYSFELIQECLNHYSIHAIRIQAKKLGLKHSKVWKEHELKVLCDGLNQKMTYEQIKEQFLSHRSPQALAAQARNQGWKSCVISTWDQQDLDLLKQGLDEGLTYSEIRDTYLPHRTSDALKTQACKQGWKLQSSLDATWNQQDLDFLKKGLDEGLTYSEIRDTYLPHRTSDALKTQAYKQNWKSQNWIQQDLDFLKQGLEESLTLQEIIDQYLPNRTLRALKYQMNKHSWKLQTSGSSWTEKDNSLLKQGLDEGLNYQQIVDKYLPHRTSAALTNQTKRKGWKLQSSSEAWTPQDNALLEQGLEEGLNYQQIVDKYLPSRTCSALENQARKQGLKLQSSSKAWTPQDNALLKQGLEEGLSIQEIIHFYLPHVKDYILYYQVKKQKNLQLAQPWLMNELFVLDLGLYNGLSLDQIQKNSLPHRTLKELEARINIPNWSAVLYNWPLPFSPENIQLSLMAGFILGDGHFTKNNSITILISKKDIHLLKWACDVFQFSYSKIKNSTVILNGKKHSLVYLYLPSTLGRLFIKHFQLHPEKSKGQVVFPSFLNPRCLKAFLLGVYFADGWAINTTKQLGMAFSSSDLFVQQLFQYVQDKDFFLHCKKPPIYKKPTETPGFDVAELHLRGRDSIRFCHFLAEPIIMQQIPSVPRKTQTLLTCDIPEPYFWTPKEDRLLKCLVRCKNRLNWSFRKISTFFVHRTYKAVVHRIYKLK